MQTYHNLDNSLTPEKPLDHKIPPLLLLYNRPQKHPLPGQKRQSINRKPCRQIPSPDLPPRPHDRSITRPMLRKEVEKEIDKEPHIGKKHKPIPFICGSITNVYVSKVSRDKCEEDGEGIPGNLRRMMRGNDNDTRFILFLQSQMPFLATGDTGRLPLEPISIVSSDTALEDIDGMIDARLVFLPKFPFLATTSDAGGLPLEPVGVVSLDTGFEGHFGLTGFLVDEFWNGGGGRDADAKFERLWEGSEESVGWV